MGDVILDVCPTWWWNIHGEYTPQKPENQPLEVWRVLLETIIFRFHVKLWGCSDLYGTNRRHRYQQGDQSWSLPNSTDAINSSSTRFSLEDEMVFLPPQKRDTIREIECFFTYSAVKILTWNQRMPHLGEREKHLQTIHLKVPAVKFFGVYSMRRSHLNFLRGLSANGNEEMQARTAEKWVP